MEAKSIIISPTSYPIAGWGFSFFGTSYIFANAIPPQFLLQLARIEYKFQPLSFKRF